MSTGIAKILFIVLLSIPIFAAVSELFDGKDEQITYLLSLVASALLFDKLLEK
jgi:hypothetical protein